MKSISAHAVAMGGRSEVPASIDVQRVPGMSSVGSHSFEAVYERNWVALYRMASLMTGSAAEGEDLAQEAFTRWYAHQDAPNPDAYLRMVLVNLCRSRHRRVRSAVRWAHLFERPDRTEPELNVLLDIVGRLPVRQRAAVILRYYEGRSDDEVAKLLQCRPGTVRSLLSRALAQLRTEFPPDDSVVNRNRERRRHDE
jgi:RNA polymerase sigma factor (sigma-70 family)